jgi:hypothetical protein
MLKTTSKYYCNEKQLNVETIKFLKSELGLIFLLKRKNSLNVFENQRRPQKQLNVKPIIFLKRKTTLIILKKRQPLKNSAAHNI